jgi:hypothetical protein
MKLVNAIVRTRPGLVPRWILLSSFLLFPLIYLTLPCAVSAQSRSGIVNAQSRRDTRGSDEDDESPLDEMRAKSEIRYAEKARLEDLDRAREAAQLGLELHNSYSLNKVLGQTERKKLDRLEKVTKKIRSRAGGSDGDVILTDVPNQMGPLLKRLAESSDDMRKAVEKTPRQIVSATVIERSNEILELIRFVRSFLQ